MNGVELIRKERARQRAAKGEGWSAAHDDGHTRGELAMAAAVYAMPDQMREQTILGRSLRSLLWPWPGEWKPVRDDRIRELVKAGALIAAEIDRLQRETATRETT